MESVKTAEHYVVLEGTTLEDLIYRVRTWKREGWIPQGGIALHSLRLGYCQAIVQSQRVNIAVPKINADVRIVLPPAARDEEEE